MNDCIKIRVDISYRKQKKMEMYVDNSLETVLPVKSCASLFSNGEVYLLGMILII